MRETIIHDMKEMITMKKRWLAGLLLTVVALLMPCQLWADDGEFDTPERAFSWYSKGPGCMHVTFKIYNKEPRCVLQDAYLVLTDPDTKENIKCFFIQELDGGNDGYTWMRIQNLLSDESHIFVTNLYNQNGKKIYVDGTLGDYHISGTDNTKYTDTYVEMDWYYPVRFAGKKMTVSVTAEYVWHPSSANTPYTKGANFATMEFDEINLETYDAIPGTEAENAGILRIPVSSDRVMNYADVNIKTANGWRSIGRTTFDSKAYSGFINLPSYEAIDSIKMDVNITAASWTDVTGNAPKSLEGNVTIKKGAVQTIHGPRLLKSEMIDDHNDVTNSGSVRLQWQIGDVGMEDLLSGDMFQVQRSLTGRIEDYEDLALVAFDKDTTDYEYIDTKLISSLDTSLIDKSLGIPLVRYRVFRAATKALWGLEHNPTVAYTMPQMATLDLPEVFSFDADWADEEEHKLKVTWQYRSGGDGDIIRVWDDRAKIKIWYKMLNRDNKEIGTGEYVLSTEELQKKEAIIPLSRSCVYYDLYMETFHETSPIAKGTGDIFVQIKSDADWNAFAKRVNDGEDKLNAMLMADVRVTKINNSVGLEKPYKGIFNGNGHTLDINFYEDSNKLSPFCYLADGAAICNLAVSGNINSNGRYSAGISSHITNGVVSIEQCIVSAKISQEDHAWFADTHTGGFVGVVDNAATLHIGNSVHKGEFSNNYAMNSGYGGFVGYSSNSAFTMVNNSFFSPTSISWAGGFVNTHTFVNYEKDLVAIAPAIIDCMYSYAFGTTQGRSSSLAPQNSLWKDGVPYVVKHSFGTPTTDFNVWLDPQKASQLNRFYYQNTGKILKESLVTETHQSSVTLTWSTDEGTIDRFEVWRKEIYEGAEWKKIADNVTNMEYEDKTVKPVFDYMYKVCSLVSCEGDERTFTNEVEGHCVKTGLVDGYVRFADGSGVPDVSVVVTPYGEGGGTTEYKATTDESGHYHIEGLPYWGGQTGAYQISTDITSTDLADNCKDGLFVTFNSELNHYENRIFTVTTGVKFSGLVLYKGTSIPVQGVKFLVDKKEVRSAGGAVTSDFEGKFSFRMKKGIHTIQAVKNDHVFYENGFYSLDGNTEVDFYEDKASIYFYDDTKVKLIGRVAGGKTQGDIPLGNSLSTNNLGADLQMVMTLEGDNASWLVFENTNRALTERDTIYLHTKHGKNDKKEYKTKVHVNRHRVEITPDVNTGEYEVLLPPVKWKIQQITARGYSTLFQDGKTNDVIDLTDSLTKHTDTHYGAWATATGDTVREVSVTYNAIYNRIYRSPIQLDYRQVSYDKFAYFGDRIYTAQSLVGDKVKVPLVYQTFKDEYKALKDKSKWNGKDSLEVRYTFGAPVFNIDREYPLLISAVEKYYYNNNSKSDTVDVVNVDGGFLTIRNGMVSGTHKDTLSLDRNGEGVYLLTAAQRPYLLTGKDALCTVNFTLLKDGVTYEGKPLKAYTLNQYSRPGAKDYASVSAPILVDVLRDPPGSGSSAKLSKGSTLKMAYQMDMSWAGGLSLAVQAGGGANYYTGIGGIGFEAGFINNAKTAFKTSFDLIFSGTGQRAFSYTMTANEDISTDAGATMVGADADVYMGLVTDVFLRPTVMIRAIPDSTFQHKIGELAAGRMVEIALGYGEKGDTFHLVRDEAIGYGQRITADFAHSQKYIISQLIPDLANQALSLMYIGDESAAQSLANSTGKPVYLSLRSKDDERFGILNTDSITKKYVYNSTRTRKNIDQSKMNYLIVLPNTDDGKSENDEVYNYANLILGWTNIIAQNEQQKLEATDLVKHFDVDGGVGMSYSEDFTTEYNNSHTFKNPISSWTHNYFEWDDVNNLEQHTSAANTTAAVFGGIAALIGKTAGQLIGSIAIPAGGSKVSGTSNHIGTYSVGENIDNAFAYFQIEFTGWKWTFGLTPVISFDSTPKQTTSTKYNRKESFTIKMDKKSHLLFDVYRVNTIDDNKENSTVTGNLEGDRDIFVETNFLRNVEYVKNFLDRDLGVYQKASFEYPKSFVYRTRGGATVRTWEDERKTLFYNAGTVLDERTKKIENPLIKMDKQSISGVPYGEPARFKLYMTNESEEPDAVAGALRFFTLYSDSKSNPDGAKLFVDGMPLTTDGMTVMAVPGEVTTKTLDVYAGEGFDYEDLKIGLISQGDLQCVDEVAFSVHYLRTAGSVAISSPGDKWIMNTDAPYDSIKGWYMPVIISGFDRNQKNFDHIEFQYKETTRGDDYWTSICSFYADSTYYRQASGTREMMPENGYINTRFFGEGVVMEKQYDLRAVLFCRNGNSYITNSSKVLTGIKDTRRPQLFGAVAPTDGIVGAGENIIFNFSEHIEHNYLRDATNFEVTGETNESALQEEPSLYFGGNGYAETDARRNFAGKSVAVDVMIRPDDKGVEMPIFSHGDDGNKLQLWLTEDWYLMARVDTMEYVSWVPIRKGSLQHVALILDSDNNQLMLYNDSVIGSYSNVRYNGYGTLIFGATNQNDVSERKHYYGRMLEARIWNRTMTTALLRSYGKRTLTGYEMGLTDYYPMSEGDGDYAIDLAQGANAQLVGASWVLPRGMSLRFDYSEEKKVKGVRLLSDFIQRSAEQDYTMMFWFKTDSNGGGALLSNGSGRVTDDNAPDKFFIGIEDSQLKFRSNGMEIQLGTGYDDDKWHHYAMTMNRSYKVANIYVDHVLKASMPADTLGGMMGDEFYLGNMVWKEAGLNVSDLHQQNALKGNMDEIYVFAQALPPTLLKRYSVKQPKGDEKGLLLYIGFSEQVRTENNELVMKPYVWNQLIKKDADGNIINERDSVFAEPIEYIMQHVDQSLGAPVQASVELKNLNFSYVGRDNQVLVNIDEIDSRINKRNVFVTLYDIPDLNGNYMASPTTAEFFIDRNPLRWERKSWEETVYEWTGADYDFTVKISNKSGSSHVYSIKNLPRWLTVNHADDMIDAMSERSIRFRVSKDLNPGTYDETIYLTDENGLSEPLALVIYKEGNEPDWYVGYDMKRYSMNVVARVRVKDAIVVDPEDVVAAFDNDGRCMGVANISYNEETGKSMLYLTVFDSTVTSKPLIFKLWHHQTGKVMMLETSKAITFAPGIVEGSVNNPIMMTAGNIYIQTLRLNSAWNWISFNVYNDDFRNVNNLLAKYKWNNGDVLVDDTEDLTLVYNEKWGKWMKNKSDTEVAKVRIWPSRSYRIYLAGYTELEVTGDKLDQESLRTITVHHGWNSVGYTPQINLPVSTALTDYTPFAKDRDVIKSREEFATYTETKMGEGYWSGSLQYMKPGEGYMLYRNGTDTIRFKYPYYEPGSTFSESVVAGAKPAMMYGLTMSLAAEVNGVEIEEGDKLLAINGAEVRGTAVLVDSVYYMSINGEASAKLTFAIERDGEIIATSASTMPFEANTVIGSPVEPATIDFNSIDSIVQGEGWYTLDGKKLSRKPSKAGIYVHDGKAVVIE